LQAGATLLYTLRNHALAVAPTIIIPDEESGAAWVQIQPDGSCRMFFPRIDMGQNANTGLAQIVAEELNLKVEEIDAVAPNTSDVPPLAVTAGSMSLTAFSRPIATAAATLREHLRERAALKLSQPIAATLDEVGGFRTANNRRVHYADLVDAATTLVEFDESKPAPTLYTFDSKRTKRQVGHSVKPLGIRELVTGAPVYTADIPFDGVLFGRAVLPPVRNASIASLNTSGVSAVKGFIKLVQEGDFVGVVCKTPSAVDAAMAQIDVTWHLQEPLNQNEIDRLVDVDAKMG